MSQEEPRTHEQEQEEAMEREWRLGSLFSLGPKKAVTALRSRLGLCNLEHLYDAGKALLEHFGKAECAERVREAGFCQHGACLTFFGALLVGDDYVDTQRGNYVEVVFGPPRGEKVSATVTLPPCLHQVPRALLRQAPYIYADPERGPTVIYHKSYLMHLDECGVEEEVYVDALDFCFAAE